MSDPDAMMAEFLRWRGVVDPCRSCSGAGSRCYSSGATWRGGIGTASLERDVCDFCWGTGDRLRHGVNLRTLRDEESQRIAAAAVDALAQSIGASYRSAQVSVHEIIEVLESFAAKRRHRDMLTPSLAESLAKMLRLAGRRAP